MLLTAKEIIAVTLGCGIDAVTDGRVKNRPADAVPIYVVCGVAYCSPSARKSPPKGFNWRRIGTEHGRDIFSGTPNTVPVAQAAGANL
jgi:hypothetical protein